ncbi:arginase [Peptoniphilus sp. KCTC 25270]|uniref:arginase n=1 Tax=Peptoniphilus sp. KCTC 25270 TaxID=2897414 RepID=UPI001E4575D1|nr:arginase [Peptoniphilus sp. KCTC 25270]MCD1147690.1 arginase [Peptoniphilus sp. KCTC 25270]
MKPEINKNISIIGAPLDMGASLRGCRLGPDAIRLAGMVRRIEEIGYDVKDCGNVEVKNHLGMDRAPNNLNNLELVKKANMDLYEAVKTELKAEQFPLILGGDHSIAIGSIKAVLDKYPNLGVIWFDAHGDINTNDTSPTGNIHGMPVATLLGLGAEELLEIGQKESLLKKENIVYIGSRDLDGGERTMMKDLGIKVYTMHEVDYYGIKHVMEEAIEYLKDRCEHIHVSFDMDVLDPTVAPGTGTKVPGGMGYREAHLSLELVAKTEKLVSAEFVEVNPALDMENMTAKAAVALAGSLLGEWLI